MDYLSLTKNFASDNSAGVHPDVMVALQKANDGHAIAYGNDPFTIAARQKFREYFGNEIDVYFVFGGTAANVLSLKALTQSHHSIICAESAHIYVDECGAPERFTGCKLLPIATQNGKLTPALIKRHLHGFDFEHHSQPKVISIAQPTEVGTVYEPEEVAAISRLAKEYGLFLHMDGARIANASVSLERPFRAFTCDVGVDVLSFGGTKNGLMFGEAVIFFNPGRARDFKYQRKQGMQLASKMRFIAVQFEAYLANDLWLRNARHANHMARRLAEKLSQFPSIQITQPVQTNGVFAIIPKNWIVPLQEKRFFYVWNEEASEVRWMTAFDTTDKDIEEFIGFIRAL